MHARADHGAVVAREGHGDEADGDGAGFCCLVGGGESACRLGLGVRGGEVDGGRVWDLLAPN